MPFSAGLIAEHYAAMMQQQAYAMNAHVQHNLMQQSPYHQSVFACLPNQPKTWPDGKIGSINPAWQQAPYSVSFACQGISLTNSQQVGSWWQNTQS